MKKIIEHYPMTDDLLSDEDTSDRNKTSAPNV